MKQLHVRSSSSDQRKYDASKRHMRWNYTAYIQKSLNILNASLTCTCNCWYTFKCLVCHPPCALQGKPKNYVLSSVTKTLPLYTESPPYPICYAPPTICCKKKPMLQWNSFLFFFTKLQPPFSFPSSLLVFLWDLLGSLIVGFSLRKHQRTIFNLAIIKLINLDSILKRNGVLFLSSEDNRVAELETEIEEVKTLRDLVEQEKSEQSTKSEALETETNELKTKL